MYTTNDALFCILQSCRDDLESNKLVYYMYLYQTAGLQFNFKYKLNVSGVVCRGLNSMLSQVVNEDKVQVSDGVVSLTELGRMYYENILLTAEEWDLIEFIKVTLDNLSEDDLKFICIVDMVVFDTLKRYGVDALIIQEEKIKSTIYSLTNNFDDEDFNIALKFLRKVKGK